MTQANYLTAAEAIDRLAVLYQHMGAASEALKDLARLEQTQPSPPPKRAQGPQRSAGQ